MSHENCKRPDGNVGCIDCVAYGADEATERIIKLLEGHRQTTKSVSGFLAVCSCGEAIDDYTEHLIALIEGESK